jgi:hypothetical protein
VAACSRSNRPSKFPDLTPACKPQRARATAGSRPSTVLAGGGRARRSGKQGERGGWSSAPHRQAWGWAGRGSNW